MNDHIYSSQKLLTRTGKLILACFILSGFSSLIYEVVWTRMMVLIFGATTLAISTVLTAFMGGLALGSLIFGRMICRRGHPLMVYAALEFLIGAYGLLIPWILPYLVPLYRLAWETLHQDFYSFSLVRFVLVSAVLLPPTILMGATLPVLGQFFSSESDHAGRCLGLLYGLNTLGAVFGTFSTGYILLPALGVHQTTWVAALSNLLVACVAMVGYKMVPLPDRILAVKLSVTKDSSSGTAPTRTLHPSSVAIILVTFSLSGFSAMVYEVTWSRTLSLVMGSTIYAFSAMLTTFLVGLALGSLASAYMVQRLRHPLLVLGGLQICVGISAFATIHIMEELPYLFVAFYNRWLPSLAWMPFLWFGISFLTMLLPTLFLGALFPLITQLLRERLTSMGRLAGDVYATNTLGAILGSFSAGFILIPAIGIQSSMMAAIYLNLILGLILLWLYLIPREADTSGAALQSGRQWALISGLIGLGVLLALTQPAWNSQVMSSGVFLQLPTHSAVLKQEGRRGFYNALGKNREMLFYKEGITATVSVEKHPELGLSLNINGRLEAGDKFLRTEVLLGHLPFLFRPTTDAEKVLVIGWGSGATVGSVTRYPVKRVVAVELEPAILETTRFFDQTNHQPLTDPRVEVTVNDGRNYLLVTPEKFDIIISQPSLPWIPGASNLFTEDFFRLGAAKLNEGGVFCQWLSESVISLEDVQSVLKSFSSAFKTVWIFRTVQGDLVLLGFTQEPRLDPDRLHSLLSRPQIQEDLNRIGVTNPSDLVALYLFGGQQVNHLASKASTNTDDNAYIELVGPLHYYQMGPEANRAKIDQQLLMYATQELETGGHLIKKFRNADSHEMLLDVAGFYLENNQGPWAMVFVNSSLKLRETARGHYLKGQVLLSLAGYMALARPDDKVSREQIMAYALQEFQKTLQIQPSPELAQLSRFELGVIYYKKGQTEQAAEQYKAILREDPLSYEANANLGAIYLQEGKLKEALKTYQGALRTHAQDQEVHFKLGLIYSRLSEYQPAINAYEEALKLSPTYLDAHFNLARVYELTHHPEKALEHYTRFLELAPQVKDYAVEREVVQAKLRQLAGTGGR